MSRQRAGMVAGVLATALLALGAGGVALEALVRWREARRDTPTDVMTTLYYRHARLERGLVRNRDYFGRVRTDSLGLRVASAPSPAPDTLLILADGGSTTFDVGVSTGDSTWPAQLGRLLSSPGRQVRVANAGVPSYRVIDNLIRFEQELHRLRPAMVLLLQGHNDLYRMLHAGPPPDPDAPDEVRTVGALRRWLERRSLAYGKLAGLYLAVRGDRAATRGRQPGASVRQRLDPGLQQFEVDVRAYVVVAHALGSRVVLLEPPHVSGRAELLDRAVDERWRWAFAGVDPEIVLDGYRRQRHVLERVSAETGAIFIPTHAYGLDSVHLYEPDDPIHFVDAGARRLAERLAIELERHLPIVP